MNQAENCRGCGGPIPPRNRNGGFVKVWCSMACRSRYTYRNDAAYRDRQADLAAKRHRNTYVPVVHRMACCECSREFVAKRSDTRYCSPLCSSRAFNARRKADGRLAKQRAESRQERREWQRADRAKNGSHHARYPEASRRATALRSERIGKAERIPPSEIFERDEWTCKLCDLPLNPTAKWPAPDFSSLDHIIPVALGGQHERSNLQAAHLLCNMRKGASAA